MISGVKSVYVGCGTDDVSDDPAEGGQDNCVSGLSMEVLRFYPFDLGVRVVRDCVCGMLLL